MHDELKNIEIIELELFDHARVVSCDRDRVVKRVGAKGAINRRCTDKGGLVCTAIIIAKIILINLN